MHDPMSGMSPVGWGNPHAHRTPKGVLYLREAIVLRRLRDGETQADAARSLGWSSHVVTGLLRNARVRLGADSVAELLTLPQVLEQLGGES